MNKKIEQFPAKNPNPVLSMRKDGTIIYSNKAGEPLLNEWGVRVGEKLPSNIVDLVQRVIIQNSPEKLEVKGENSTYLLTFNPIFEDECVNIYGFDITDRKELEEKLRESEEKYRNIIETANEGIWIVDAEFRTNYVNKKMLDMIGYSLREMIGISVEDFVDKEYKIYTKMIIEKRQQGIDEVHENKFIRKDGSSLWVLINSKSLFNNSGKFTGALAMLTDITERKEAEIKLKETLDNLDKSIKERTDELVKAYNSLKESEELLTEAQRLAHIGSYYWNIKTDEEYWSEELYHIFKLDPRYRLNHNIFLSYIHPDDLEYVSHAINEALHGKPYSIDYRIILPDGEECIIHSQGGVIFDEKNTPIRMRGIVQDITERKKTEEKIKMLADMVESSNDTIVTRTLDGIVTSWNKGAEQMHGYSADEIIGKKITILEPDDHKEELNRLAEKVKRGEKIKNYETVRLKKDGTRVNVSITLSPVFDSSGKLIAISTISRDITNRIKAKEALAKTEEARRKEIHHRIKNNLQVISSLLDLQAEKFSDTEVLEAFRESQNRVISMSLIHEELYKGNGTDTLDFSEYIQKLAENLFHTYDLGNKNILLRLNLEDNAFFNMDISVPLGIIVNELISNSLKHAFRGRDGGEIRIKLLRDEKVKREIENRDTNFIISILDNGVGIPEELNIEDLDSLGIQLVTTLVDQLDGELELKRDNGTEFIIRFSVTERNNQVSVPFSPQLIDNE